ncbi:UNVERIFIED_CONTAM: hypothetical protein ACS92_02950 [Bacillus cereus]
MVDVFVELLHNVQPRVHWKLRVQQARLDSEVLQKKFELVSSVELVHKQQDFSFDQAQLQYHVDQQELVELASLDVVLDKLLLVAVDVFQLQNSRFITELRLELRHLLVQRGTHEKSLRVCLGA